MLQLRLKGCVAVKGFVAVSGDLGLGTCADVSNDDGQTLRAGSFPDGGMSHMPAQRHQRLPATSSDADDGSPFPAHAPVVGSAPAAMFGFQHRKGPPPAIAAALVAAAGALDSASHSQTAAHSHRR